MNNFSKIICFTILASLASAAFAQHVPNSEKQWAWLYFKRPDGINPVISPDTCSTFYCPMKQTVLRW